MADVFTVLAKDHEAVKGMLAELEKGPARAAGTSEDQLALRKKMAEELIIEESKHEALEEMYFWPVVREHHPAGNTLADEATGQEQEAKQVLAELDGLEAGDPEFEVLLGTFTGAAREHIEFEGPRSGRACGRFCPPRPRPSWAARSPTGRRPRRPGRIRTRPRRRACSKALGQPWPRRTGLATR